MMSILTFLLVINALVLFLAPPITTGQSLWASHYTLMTGFFAMMATNLTIVFVGLLSIIFGISPKALLPFLRM